MVWEREEGKEKREERKEKREKRREKRDELCGRGGGGE